MSLKLLLVLALSFALDPTIATDYKLAITTSIAQCLKNNTATPMTATAKAM